MDREELPRSKSMDVTPDKRIQRKSSKGSLERQSQVAPSRLSKQLSLQPNVGSPDVPQRKQGWLLKWTNYMKGFRERWFVLDKGVISYYKSKEEMAHACRGTLVLKDAKIELEAGFNFTISIGGKKHAQSFQCRAHSEAERQEWILALEIAKSQFPAGPRKFKAMNPEIQIADYSDSSDSDDEDGDEATLRSSSFIQETLAQVTAAHEKVAAVTESLRAKICEIPNVSQDVLAQSESLKDASGKLLSLNSEFVNEILAYQKKWKREMKLGETKMTQLEDTLETLAREHRRLERNANRMQRKGTLLLAEEYEDSENEDQFFDAQDDLPPPSTYLQVDTNMELTAQFRRRSAVPFKPKSKLGLWSVMKNAIGKDLSKIPMPVNFNEPLSFTQRLVEDLEYSDILDRGAQCVTSQERMAFVAAFTVSSFANVAQRTGKPFNPLLGETFELDVRKEHGYRAVVEQVSHHPPICALHAESDKWIFWQEFSMNSKFRGKYLEVVPTGISHLIFRESGDHYTWTKVPTVIHNIIVGKLWLDQHGTMEIKNHTTGDVCNLKYIAYSYFTSTEARKVLGKVVDAQGEEHYEVQGSWDCKMSMWPVGKGKESQVELWQRHPLLPECGKMYGFSKMAITLNEITPQDEGFAPTDSRLRPDKNLMEAGDFDSANKMKMKLEAAQRKRRKAMEAAKTTWSPVWFVKKQDPIFPEREVHVYNGKYWEAKDQQVWEEYPVTDIYKLD